jgi:ketosteroid isomerase-like protein
MQRPFRAYFRVLIALVIHFATAAATASAQETPGVSVDSLYQVIAAQDSAMFAAYNRCDLDALASFFVEDLEFYHDQTGLSRGRQALVNAVERNICGKVRRDLVPGSLEVYPLRSYGAVATGIHKFCDPRSHADCLTDGGPARFITLWRWTDDGWKITRVISYDHH